MTATVTPIAAVRVRRELAHRSSGDTDVYLLWCPDTDTLAVVVSAESGAFELVVAAAEALDAFDHPYAYAAYRGLERPVAAAA